MNKQLETILNDLQYDKVFVETIDGYDNKYLNEFNNWSFTKVYSFEKNDFINIITFESNFAWNEQIWKSLYEIRKKCIQKYGYDIIPLDYDMCTIFDFWNNNIHTENIKQSYINKIRHKYNKKNIFCKYILSNNIGIMPLINHEIYFKKIINNNTHKFKKYQRYTEKYLSKYFNKHNIEFECWTYYNI